MVINLPGLDKYESKHIEIWITEQANIEQTYRQKIEYDQMGKIYGIIHMNVEPVVSRNIEN